MGGKTDATSSLQPASWLVEFLVQKSNTAAFTDGMKHDSARACRRLDDAWTLMAVHVSVYHHAQQQSAHPMTKKSQLMLMPICSSTMQNTPDSRPKVREARRDTSRISLPCARGCTYVLHGIITVSTSALWGYGHAAQHWAPEIEQAPCMKQMAAYMMPWTIMHLSVLTAHRS